MAKVPRPTNRFNSSTKVIAAVVCLALLLSTTPLVTANNGKSGSWNWHGLFSQGHQNGSRRDAPEGVFPNLDEMRRTTDERRRYGVVDEPSIPDPIPSTRRRWRRGSQAAQPFGNVEVNLNALIAFAYPRSDIAIPWLISPESESISTLPLGLSFSSAKDYAPDHKAAAEPAGIAASVALSAQSPSNFAMARLAPQNRTGTPGVDLLSKNFNWSLGLIGLRGRSGLDLGLSLTYNSRVWTKSGDYYLDFDLDEGTPAPGFRLGFPVVQGLFYNDQASAYFYMLITPAGQRIELRRLGTSNVYQTVDATYAQLTDYGSYFIFRADGAQLKFVPANGEYRCTEVKDRNGNYLTIAYNPSGDISTITDTLARVLTFSYDGNSNLLQITQVWGTRARSWATFGYGERYVGNNFTYPLVSYGPIDTNINVLTQVGLPDGSRYNFEYNNYYGMVSEIRHHAKDGHERRRTKYTYSASGSDCPTVSAQREWAENWNGDVNGTYAVNEEAVTYFGVDGNACTVTLPNGVFHKQFYGTGWQAGLATQTETWSEGVRRKWTTYAWTQDNTGVSYLLNPRLIETNVNDVEGNLRRTTISYGPYEQYSLPYLVREYAGPNGTIPIRDTYTNYNLGQAYLDRRIIGLVSWVHVSDTAQWQTKITYGYDDPTKIESLPAAPTRHDPSFNTSFLTRGNVTSVSRWDVTDIDNSAKELKTEISYNITGSVIRTKDPANHFQTLSYNDSFSDNQNGRNTFAYPTTATDADGSSSYAQYNFDFAAVTRTQGPPVGQSEGAIQTMTYDKAGRIQWIVNQNNGAWKYSTYSDRGDAVMSQETINAAPPSFWRITVVDGANRLRASGGDHPGSSGGYSAVFTYYDSMGRVEKRSNPTETTGSWAPAGDDYTAGWVHTLQTYDWQGRPLITTNPGDNSTKVASYSGCGCAGGEVETISSEIVEAFPPEGGYPTQDRRISRTYKDVLGRQVKSETLKWDDTVYSATVTEYNARDQVTAVKEYKGQATVDGSCPTATCQQTTMSYDGYGRLKTRHVPEQDGGANTTWDYNADDTTHKITDARGASQTFSYNNRHLVSGISYWAPSGITSPTAVAFTYDAAGNRTSMTDGTGSHSYQYDQLSRITSETRTFTGLSGQSFTLGYGYNLAGQVTTLTEPAQFGSSVAYAYDSAGRLNGVTGSGFAGGVSHLASGMKYRAWNALKEMNYGNNLRLNNGFNARLQITDYQVKVPGTPEGQGERARTSYQYQADGSIKQSTDFTDQYFSRYYSYDHVGRLRSYDHFQASFQSFGYDEFDHMTYRRNGSWRYFTDTGSDYQNNRNIYTISVPGSYPSCCPPQPSYWTYSADGEVLHDHNKEYTYDAAGNKTRVFETSEVGVSLTKRLWIYQDYDGDGVRAKRVEQQQFNQGPYSFKTSYYLRSSVVDGNLLIELNEFGQQREHFVYAAGEILAKQKDNQVRWLHVDPVTNSTRETSTDGTLGERLEFDPLGNDIPLTDPNSDEPPDYLYAGNYGVVGNPYDGSSGCALDGQPMPCSLATGLINIGAAGICPNNNCGPRFNGAEWEFLRFDENGMYYSRRIAYQEKRRASKGTQRPQQRPQDPNQTVIDLVTRTFANEDCFQFLKAVLNKASTKSNPVLKGGDIRAISQDFLTQTNGSLSREKVEGARYGSAKGTIRSDGKGNAVIYRGLAASGSQDWYDARGIAAELPHLAGSKGGWPRPEYHDLDLARAAYDTGYDKYFSLKSVENPFITFPNRRSQEKNRGSMIWSSYFHDIMNQLCPVPGVNP